MSIPEPELAALVDTPSFQTEPSDQRVQEFDFGAVLARGQTLLHEFALTNPTSLPIRLLKAATSIPCCSAIGPLPKSIPPGGTVQVPIILDTKNKSGPLHVNFAVQTDSLTIPVRRLSVSARLIPEWQIEPEGESIGSLSMGQTGRCVYQIACRRTGLEGSGFPENIKASGPIRAVLKRASDQANGSDGIIEATGKVEVELIAASQPGLRRGEILFQWADGRTRSHTVGWEVRPLIKATPSGLVIKPSKEPISLVVTAASEDRSFRILKVDGPLANQVQLPGDARRTHVLRFVVDPAKVGRIGLSDIKITTDHPEQPTVSIALLMTPSSGGDD